MIAKLMPQQYWLRLMLWSVMAALAVVGVGNQGGGAIIDIGFRIPVALLVAMVIVSLYGTLCAATLQTPNAHSASAIPVLDDTTWSTKCFLGGTLTMSFAVVVALFFVRANEDAISADVPIQYREIVVIYSLLLLGIEAFAWGMFWATLCSRVPSVVALTVLSLAAAWFITLFPTAALPAALVEVLAVRAALASAAFFGSKWLSATNKLGEMPLSHHPRAALRWKENREQRAVWLAFAIVAAVIVFSVNRAVKPMNPSGSRLQGPLIVAVTAFTVAAVYGLVCAGISLAGERENGTLAFLDECASTRTEVWTVKCIVGAAYTSAQAVLVGSLLLLSGFREGHEHMPDAVYGLAVILSVVCVSLETFAWGMLASSIRRTSLGAIVLGALPPLVIAAPAINQNLSWPVITKAILVQSLPAAVALFLSCRWFDSKFTNRESLPKFKYTMAATSDPSTAEAASLVLFRFMVLPWVIGAGLLFVFTVIALQATPGDSGAWSSQMIFLGKAAAVAAAMVLMQSLVAWVRSIAGNSFTQMLAACVRAIFAVLNGAAVLLCVFSVDEGSRDPLRANPIVLIAPAASILFAAWWSVSRRQNDRAFSPPWAVAAVWVVLLELTLLVFPTGDDRKNSYSVAPSGRYAAARPRVDGLPRP